MSGRELGTDVVDVHHHPMLPGWIEALGRKGIGDGGGVKFPGWSAGADLELMDRQGIAAALFVGVVARVFFDDVGLAKRLARECNEGLAELVRAHPKRFGGLAVLPLPDVEAGLAELAYALDVLRLDGVGLLTNVGGFYLGDPLFDPLMAELDRRQAVVFVHPHETSERPSRLRPPPAIVRAAHCGGPAVLYHAAAEFVGFPVA